jgi:hypothetical protein
LKLKDVEENLEDKPREVQINFQTDSEPESNEEKNDS